LLGGGLRCDEPLLDRPDRERVVAVEQLRVPRADEVARGLGLRAQPSAIVSGPSGTETLQDSPSLQSILDAVDQVN
jgi:hypothetical protein